MSRLLTLSKEFKKQTLATIRDKSGRLSGYRIPNLHPLAWAFAMYVVIITALKSSAFFNANRSAPYKDVCSLAERFLFGRTRSLTTSNTWQRPGPNGHWLTISGTMLFYSPIFLLVPR